MTRSGLKLKLICTLAASALGALSAAPAPAADTSSATAGSSAERSSEQRTGDMRASKIIGMKVRNPQDENLGKIDDLIIDTTNERVAYAILSFGGVMGMGDKRFAYPVGVFQPTADRKELVLNLDKDKLKQAPGFENNKWPDWNRDNYRAQVDRYFGPTISPTNMPNQHLTRASDLIGKGVDERGGKRIGKIDDLVVNLGTSKVHYAVLDLGKPWTMNDTLVPIALTSFTVPPDLKGNMIAKVSRDQIDLSHGFKDRNWPDLNDPTYQHRVDSYLSSRSSSAGVAGPRRDE